MFTGKFVAFALIWALIPMFLLQGCQNQKQPHITIGSKFFTEQVILAELLAQHIESTTGIHVVRKSNLGGTLLCQKALLSGDLDLYVEYTGTALTAVLGAAPEGDASAIYQRVKQGYAQRFALDVTEPLGFENSFAMVIRGDDATRLQLHTISDIVPLAPHWHAGFGYEFLERPDGYKGWSDRYGLHFASQPSVMDLGLIYRALVDKKVDIVAGNSTDGLIDALHLAVLQDDRHYFPPYDAVPIVRQDTLAKFPPLRAALSSLAGKISADEMRHLNAQVDAEQRDVATVVRAFRAAKGL
ncbi:MAG TPA: glycine betaine ABC transporter substrate-binding protein [Candidatus Acidoferrum sp.]|jgi:osmoprotectant transport system substrate-binding protein